MLALIAISVGLLLLARGRRLYWLFVAAAGFATALALAPYLLIGQPDWVVLLASLALALAGSLLAVVAQTVAVALVGFLAGGGSGVLLLRALEVDSSRLVWIVFLVAGVAGLVIGLVLFDWALILLSSLAGANLVVLGVASFVHVPRAAAVALVVLAALVGILVQSRAGRAAPPRTPPAARP